MPFSAPKFKFGDKESGETLRNSNGGKGMKEDSSEVLEVAELAAAAARYDQLISVGTELKNKQTEWSELLQYDEIIVKNIPENSITDISLRCELAALYYMDAVKGRMIDYPQSPSEVWCYRITRSSRFMVLFSLITLLNMVLPFLAQPYCAWTSDKENNGVIEEYGSSDASNYLSRDTLWIISVISLCVFYFEVSSRYYAGYSVRTLEGYFSDRWLVFRFVACVALTADYWGSHKDGGVYTLSTACIPFLYISRRHSLRQIVEGVIFAARKCVDVFLLLLFLILLWSLVGYLIFHNIDVGDDKYSKFDNLSESFYMCIQTFATRSFLPFVLKPYYAANPISALFFVSLTIVTDLLCTALIIATGNRQYRVHANNVFDEQLKCRKHAVIAAYQLLCHVPDGTKEETSVKQEVDIEYLKSCVLIREKWVAFCQQIPTTHITLTEQKVHLIFNLESHGSTDDSINLEGFFKLCAILDSKFFIGLSEDASDFPLGIASEAQDGNVFQDKQRSSSSSFGRVSTLHVNVDGRQSRLHSVDDDSLPDAPKISPRSRKKKRRVSIASGVGTSGIAGSSGGRSKSVTTISEESSGILSLRSRSSIISSQNKKEELMRSQIKKSADDRTTLSDLTKQSRKQFKESCYHMNKIIQQVLRTFLELTITISTERIGMININIFDSIVVIMRLCLVVTQLAISKENVVDGWLYFWWFLEFYFWGEMIFLLFACGWKKYITDRGMGIPIVVNIMSLILMSMSTRNENRTGAVYILTVLTQCVRLPSLIMQYEAASVFNSIIPLVFRVIFIIFAVIYFFSALTFNRFCAVLDANLVQAEIDAGADDFISPWVTYANELNFRTFAGSLFTMFEISILGNWSSIMNSARQKELYWPLFWFFSFRLMMLLCIYPILNSFIIAAYIARKDLQAKQREERNKEMLIAEQKLILDDIDETNKDMGDIELGSMKANKVRSESGDISENSDVKLEINAGTSSRSMISFWSVSGTERYVPKSQKTTSDCGGSSDELRRMQVEIDALRGEVSRWEIQHIEAESRLAQLRAELKAHEA